MILQFISGIELSQLLRSVLLNAVNRKTWSPHEPLEVLRPDTLLDQSHDWPVLSPFVLFLYVFLWSTCHKRRGMRRTLILSRHKEATDSAQNRCNLSAFPLRRRGCKRGRESSPVHLNKQSLKWDQVDSSFFHSRLNLSIFHVKRCSSCGKALRVNWQRYTRPSTLG